MPNRTKGLSPRECQELPAVVRFPELAAVFSMGETKAREMINDPDQEYPVPVEKWGNTYVAFRSQILKRLGIRDIYADEPAHEEVARLAARPALERAS